MTDIRGAVVIVTGASSGIGAATARLFGREGARVVLAARRLDRLQAIAAEIEAAGGETLVVAADMSRPDDIARLIEHAHSRFGRLDVLVNNAGFGRLDWLERLDPAKDIEALVAVNILGVVNASRLVLPIMMAQRRGHIINISSTSGLVATPTYTVYAASKFAVRGFGEALRREVAPWGIKVSTLYPGGVATEFAEHAQIRRKTQVTTPGWLLLSPEQVAEAVLSLVRHPRAELVIPWPFRLAAFFNHWLPGVVDWAVIRRFTIPEREDELRGK
ncbi:MAG: SDR family NAD(P)-dependent oxidoreductase [Anaerolineales bacterium]